MGKDTPIKADITHQGQLYQIKAGLENRIRVHHHEETEYTKQIGEVVSFKDLPYVHDGKLAEEIKSFAVK